MRAMMIALGVALAIGCGSSSSPPGQASFPSQPLATMTSDSGRLAVSVWTAPDQPPSRGVLQVRLAFTDTSNGTAADGLSLEVVPWMPAHGHGTSVVPTVAASGRGVYVVDNVNLYMPGHWELRVAVSGPVEDHVTPAFDIP